MALAIDASSPARVAMAANTTRTTASFTPPDNSLLVACMGNDSNTGVPNSWAMSNSGAALTWTLVSADDDTLGNTNTLGGRSAVAYAWLSTSRSLTVTSTIGASEDHALKVYVVTGADPVGPVGNTKIDHVTNNASTTYAAYNSSVNNSLTVYALMDWAALGTPTSGDTEDTYNTATQICGMSAYKAITTTAGTSVTLDWDFPGTNNTSLMIAAIEIKPAPDGPSIRNTASATGSSSVVVPVPSGTIDGDQLVVCITCAGDQTVSSVPSGWTLIRVDNQGTSSTDIKQYLYKRVASSEPANYTWSL